MNKSTILRKFIFNEEELTRDLGKIKNFPVIEEEYDEFATGIWLNHSLWNENGNYHDTQYRDATSCKPTTLGEELSYINHFINTHFDTTHLKMVRSRNLINGLVMPHRDFIELEKNQDRYLRILIPLESNPSAFHSDEDAVFQMKQGEAWILNAAKVHSAANFSHDSRIILCLDFQFNEPIANPYMVFKNDQHLNSDVMPTIIKRKPFNGLTTYFHALERAISERNFREIAFELSKLHFHYDVDIKQTYDWLINITTSNANKELISKSEELKRHMIISRNLGEHLM